MNINPNEGARNASPQPHSAYPSSPQQTANRVLDSLWASLQDLFPRYKAVLMHPKLATFDAEVSAANWQSVWVGVGLYGVEWVVFLILGSLVTGYALSFGSMLQGVVGAFLLFSLGFFFVTVGVWHLIATKLFGGTGSFLTYAYLASLAVVATEAIGAVAVIIPVVGGLVFLAANLYSWYLMVLATQAAHRIPPGKAWATVLIPAGVTAVLSCAFYGLVIALLLAALPHAAH